MAIPPAGKVQTPLTGLKSDMHPDLVFAEQLSVTGTLTINIGAFAKFGGSMTKSVVATLAQTPTVSAGTAFTVSVAPVANVPNQYVIKTWQVGGSAATAAALVNVVGMIGSAQVN